MFKKIINNKLIRKIILFILFIISLINKITIKKKHLILFYDGTNRSIIDNSEALSVYLRNNGYTKYKIIYCVPAAKVKYIDGIKNYGAIRGMFKFLKSKYVFYSFGDMRIKPSKKQIVVQLDHGVPFKKSGKMADDKAWQNEKINNFTYTVSKSKFFNEYITKTWDIEEDKILMVGQPRCDYLFTNSDKFKHIIERNYKKMILWMPTFRNSSNGRFHDSKDFKSDTGLPIIYDAKMLVKLDDYLKENDALLVIKSHRVAPLNLLDVKLSNIVLYTNEDLIKNNILLYEFISEFDCLITDYSSVFIDYLLLNKPIIFTIDDFDSYSSGRGFIVDNILDYMPGEKVCNYVELQNSIKNILNNTDLYYDERNRINDIFNEIKGNFSFSLLKEIGINKGD